MRLARSSVVASALLAGAALLVPSGRAEAQSVGFFPGVGAVPDGVSLSATPVVTADRRYVRLALNPTFSAIDGFSTFPVPAAVAGGNAGPGGGGLGGGGLGGLGGNAGAGGGAGGGFRNVGPGVPYNLEFLEASRKADARARAEAARPLGRKKAPADPVMVPMKKARANAPGGPKG